MKTVDQITEILESLSDSELKDLWNDYQMDNSMDGQIYEFDDEFFENFFSNPTESARAVYFGEIESWNAKYVAFNGAGNIVATNDPSELISIYDLADHIDRNQDDFKTLLEN